MATKRRISTRLLGWVNVDSGTLIVGDPVYILPEKASGTKGIDYARVLEATSVNGPSPAYLGGRAVVFIVGFGGDGRYPVYGEYQGKYLLTRVISTWSSTRRPRTS